jgi:hypothetical protein
MTIGVSASVGKINGALALMEERSFGSRCALPRVEDDAGLVGLAEYCG